MKDTMDNTLRHLLTGFRYTIVSVVFFGLLYPFVMTGLAQLIFPYQANGSMIAVNGKTVGSEIIGQLWTKPQYFHGRLSAAGAKGYDPTSTGGTNYGPTSAKLLANTAAAVKEVIKENPDATGPVPADLVSSSASGIDPEISPAAAYFQVARVAKARHLSRDTVRALVDKYTRGRDLGFLGEPRVNVLELNLALDANS
ncbi:MAG TPA: potassium-transporting ATPase subunit KdpC [Candidatus Acidoferrales bacterium]|nr:potassium-transporting ATPase subunit KdpC [Candidatus Acidoferrales bacterium]